MARLWHKFEPVASHGRCGLQAFRGLATGAGFRRMSCVRHAFIGCHDYPGRTHPSCDGKGLGETAAYRVSAITWSRPPAFAGISVASLSRQPGVYVRLTKSQALRTQNERPREVWLRPPQPQGPPRNAKHLTDLIHGEQPIANLVNHGPAPNHATRATCRAAHAWPGSAWRAHPPSSDRTPECRAGCHAAAASR